MITRWFRPSFRGDFRIEADEDPSRSILTVHDPTPGEIRRLTTLLRHARGHGWITEMEGVSPQGDSRLVLRAPVHEVAPLILGDSTTVCLTVVSEGGVITGTYDSPRVAGGAGGEEGKEEAAVTTRKPRAGRGTGDCPEALASEVLQAFCTPVQWKQWEEKAYIDVVGHLSGHLYRLRHRKRYRGQPVAYDLDDGLPVLANDWFVPPPEEVLAFKLVFEHRERWLRNPTILPGGRDAFMDPFLELHAREARESDLLSQMGESAAIGFSIGTLYQG